MKNTSEWNTFMKTGKIEDYLRYTGTYRESTVNAHGLEESKVRSNTEKTHAESGNSFRNYNKIGTDKRI